MRGLVSLPGFVGLTCALTGHHKGVQPRCFRSRRTFVDEKPVPPLNATGAARRARIAGKQGITGMAKESGFIERHGL